MEHGCNFNHFIYSEQTFCLSFNMQNNKELQLSSITRSSLFGCSSPNDRLIKDIVWMSWYQSHAGYCLDIFVNLGRFQTSFGWFGSTSLRWIIWTSWGRRVYVRDVRGHITDIDDKERTSVGCRLFVICCAVRVIHMKPKVLIFQLLFFPEVKTKCQCFRNIHENVQVILLLVYVLQWFQGKILILMTLYVRELNIILEYNSI